MTKALSSQAPCVHANALVTGVPAGAGADSFKVFIRDVTEETALCS